VAKLLLETKLLLILLLSINQSMNQSMA